ncbi:hypothetical protein K239x_06350 [Planctomycetes bacterium K23_9]|uniref:Uncharacterized protein n=2 Tax=Stieleria marina TaxID=1930275 RepID=A0A517NNK6_9BACT|nr:hypothetical protein K239x_06350 [Planctomycetes bacterium K23_9]
MMHHHGEFASAGDLAVHVQRQHHDDVANGDDFHWHLVLPRDLDGDGDESNDNLPVGVAINAAVGTGLSVGSATGQFVEGERLLFDIFCRDDSAAGQVSFSRLQTGRLASNVRPAVHTCAVLCVIRV